MPAPEEQKPPVDSKSTPKAPAPAPKEQPKPAAPKKKPPAQEKDDTLKFEMKYVNGGFNNGVQIKPDKNGKALIEISIYGGGTKKSLSVGPLPEGIQKLVKAYEISAQQNSDSPEITGELQKYFEEMNTMLSQKIIQILSDMDAKVVTAIKETLKEMQR